MKLHEATKQLVTQFGENIVTEIKLANLLADLNAFEDYPAMKLILKNSLKAGYGTLLLQAYRQEKKNAIDKSREITVAFVKETGFKEDLVTYGFECILFGLGCITSVNEPFSSGFDPYCKDDKNVLDNLSDKLNAFKKQYLDLLDCLIVKPKDILNDAPAYYTTESLNQLYAIEAKIYVLQKELKNTDYNWCKEQREIKINFYFKEKSQAVAKILDNLKQKYKNLLKTMLVIPTKFFIKHSGYYTTDGLQKLDEVENDIKHAYHNMMLPYDNWCEEEKTGYLSKHKVESHNIIFQIVGKICVPAAILLGALGTIISYISSFDAITQFEQTIEIGEQSASKEDYGSALQLFDKAKNNYEASFRTSHYKYTADNHINAVIDKAVSVCNGLIEKGKLAKAKTLLDNLPQEIVNTNEVNKDKVSASRAALTKAIDEGIDKLVLNIFQNNGHLDESTKAYLEELLKINPKDYWLNFIKDKKK